MKPVNPPVVSVVGRSGSGKTTLIEKLIPELKKRGYRVGTVKHHAHPGFEIDKPGKDSWRHAQAGSDHIVIAAPGQIASIRKTTGEMRLAEVVAGMGDVDIVLTDGYKQAQTPKVEVVRAEVSQEPLCSPEELIALVTDLEIEIGVPRYDLNNATGLVDLIIRHFFGQPNLEQ